MLWVKSLFVTAAAALSVAASAATPSTTYHTTKVQGVDIFYREAGDPRSPTLVLLHGRQTSSHMYRELIGPLSEHYHVIAPDLPGFGRSGTPPITEFAYTFDHLADVASTLLKQLGITRYGLMMQDYGVGVGFRIAAAEPEKIISLVIQNGVICELPDRQPVWLDAFWTYRDPAAEKRLRNSYRLETTIKYYTIGAQTPERVSPDAWILSQYYLDLPGRQDAQVELMHDFPSNVAKYGQWQEYLRKYQPPTLVLWGKDSPIFDVKQSECYRAANPSTVIRVYPGGHLMLEEHWREAVGEILRLRPKNR